MNIKIGQLYKNKTWEYMLPALKGHGEKLRNKLSAINKLGVGIHDELLAGSSTTELNLVYILTDKAFKPKNWAKFMVWVSFEPYFVTDYVFGSRVDSRKHMLVLELPDKYNNAYTAFLEGRYGDMYSDKQLKSIFGEKNINSSVYKVLSRNPLAVAEFKQKVMEEYNVTVAPIRTLEYELPLRRDQEVFNHELNTINPPYYITSKKDIL
jgi:hypothetical protein